MGFMSATVRKRAKERDVFDEIKSPGQIELNRKSQYHPPSTKPPILPKRDTRKNNIVWDWIKFKNYAFVVFVFSDVAVFGSCIMYMDTCCMIRSASVLNYMLNVSVCNQIQRATMSTNAMYLYVCTYMCVPLNSLLISKCVIFSNIYHRWLVHQYHCKEMYVKHNDAHTAAAATLS